MVHKKNQKQRARVEQTTIAMQVRDKEITDRLKYGAPVEEKSDKQLYFVDKKGGSVSSNSGINYLTKSEKILLPNANVEQLSNGPKNNEPLIVRKVMTPVEKKYLKHVGNVKKEKSLLPSKQTARKHRANEKVKKLELWEDHQPKVTKKTIPIEKDNDFITNNLLENRVVPARKIKHPSIIKKVSNIEIAEPGMSYNPSFQDHQDTLGVALAKEIVALEYIENVDNILNPEQLEYQEDLLNSIDDQETTGDGSESSKKLGDRITKLEKNKRIRRAEEKKRQQAALQRKLFNQQIDQVSDTLSEVIEEEEHAKKLNQQRVEKKTLNTLPKRIGKFKFSEIAQPILLTNELPKSLSTLTNNNYNPLLERYQNLQKRHIIEASGPQQRPTKAYRKLYTSNSWNNTTVATLD